MAETAEGGRKLRAKERKHYTDVDIDEDDIDGKRNYNIEEKLLRNNYTGDFVQVLKGDEFNMKFMQENGLQNPIVFYDKTGLGMRVPSENFQVSDVKQCVGSRRLLDVMDVNTQKGMEMSMKEWVRYYTNPGRDRLLNVISLEFSHTRLENYVESPTLVRQIDWVDRVWPRHLKECQTEATNIIDKMKYPKVQKYCLMSVAGCYTDFHIDFGGTSVWYHILHGEKVFWLIPPTHDNVERYVNWVLSAKQGDYFLADHMDQCQMIRLKAGYTFIIPSGWIHAVYTPVDSLVFGGNFLHSFNIPNQILVAQVEDRTHVPQKFRYPFYNEILWYVLDRYLWCLTGKTYLQKPDIKDDPDERPDSPASMQIDDDSRPPSRNPDSRPPSRSLDDLPQSESKVKTEGEETPKLSKSITIELTRIDDTLKTSLTDDEYARRLSRKCASDPSLSETFNREEREGGTDYEEKENGVKTEDGAEAEVKPKRAPCLTKWELDGLRRLIKWVEGLNALPAGKRGIPKDLIDPEALLQDIRQAVKEHESDDHTLSCTGEPLLGWPESTRKIKPRTIRTGYGTGPKTKAPKGAGSSSTVRRRRTRCKKCEACTRTECGECTFCKDMRKFGGPGRMKQSCVSRQCMAPILPHLAVCLVCGLARRSDDTEDEDDDNPTASLMECGICWEIVHPQCLRDTFESVENDGIINEDLPSSWECIKCVNAGKQGQLRPRVWKGVKPAFTDQPRSVANSERSTPSPSLPTAPGHALTPLKLEETDEGTTSPVEGKRVTAKEGIAVKKGAHKVPQMAKKEKLLRKAIKRSMDKTKGTEKHSTSPSPSGRVPAFPTSSPSGTPQRVDRPTKRESDRERGAMSDRGDVSGGKRPRREGASRERDLDTDSGRDSRGQSPSIKKLRPRRERERERAPEEEALGSGARTSPTPGHSRWEGRRHHDDHKPSSSRQAGAGGGGSGHSAVTSPGPSRATSSRAGTPDKSGQMLGGAGLGSAVKPGGQDTSTVGITERDPYTIRETFVVRPPDLPPPPEQVMLNTGRPHRLERGLWMHVFSFLRPSDLAHCLQVCKAWNRWAIHHSLWPSINLARTNIKQTHLCGSVLRQPRSLDLTNAAISYKQLAWLVARLPQLKELSLSGQPWATISALCSPNTPLLRSLTVSWATGIQPACFEELIEPPVGVKPGLTPSLSRLHQLRYLDLSGTEINDSSLELISAHLPLLEVLNLTCCMRITDAGLEALACQGRPLLLSLQALCLVRCLGLTDKCLPPLANLQRLRSLNLSKIPHISRTACSRFLQQYSYRQLSMTVPGIFSVVD